MIPVPYYQVAEFLSWLSERQKVLKVESERKNTLKRLALQYLNEPKDRGPLFRVLHIFQVCPKIDEPDIHEQMKHFISCGSCLPYILDRYRQYPEWVSLHPLLEDFLMFCHQREWADFFKEKARDFNRDWVMFENLDYTFREYIYLIGPDLLRAFEQYIETVDPAVILDFRARRSELRDSNRLKEMNPEEGTIRSKLRDSNRLREMNQEEDTLILGTNENLEQAADRLVDSLFLLREGRFYTRTWISPQVCYMMAAMGIISKNAAQGIEFLSWLREKHPKLDLLGNVPEDEILPLIVDFCDEKGFTNAKNLSKEVTMWLHGDIDKLVLPRLTEMGARMNRESNRIGYTKSPFNRYLTVPYHAMFLFLSAGDFPKFIKKYWEDLNFLTADWLDIYYSLEDLQRRVSGYEISDQLRSVLLDPMSLPALLLWKQSLSDCCIVPLERLSHDQIFDLMKLVVQKIVENKSLENIRLEACKYVNGKLSSVGKFPQIVIEQGEITMNEEHTHISGVNISGVNGQVFLGRFETVVADLKKDGKDELAKSLMTLKKAIETSQELSDEQKEDQIGVINQIGEEVAKDKPNKTLLNGCCQALMSAVRCVPDIANSVVAITKLLNL